MRVLKAALIGRSLTHSISPEVHEAVFPYACPKQLRSSYDHIEYRKIECADEDALIETLRRGVMDGMHGYNVTFPYKDVASHLSGQVDPLVREIHSGNTVLFVPGDLRVYSTDGAGLRESLHKELPNLTTSRYHLVLLGAGGAARAAMQALYTMGWGAITACARSVEHARLAFGHYGGVQVRSLEALTPGPLHHLIIQATPVGQRSREALIEGFDWKPGDIGVDLVYNPLRTRFLDLAAQGGATIISGLGMLIEQAALSQYIWIKEKPRETSPLSLKQYQELFSRLTSFVTPRWDTSVF